MIYASYITAQLKNDALAVDERLNKSPVVRKRVGFVRRRIRPESYDACRDRYIVVWGHRPLASRYPHRILGNSHLWAMAIPSWPITRPMPVPLKSDLTASSLKCFAGGLQNHASPRRAEMQQKRVDNTLADHLNESWDAL